MFLLGMSINKQVKSNYPTWFFTLLFASIGITSWEIVEFIIDSILHTNLQEWQYITKEIFDGLMTKRGHALVDTMNDMINGFLGYLSALLINTIIKKPWK